LAKIIVAALPIPGEFTPLLQISRGLAARGHQVTMLTGSGFRSAVERAGLAFAPLTGSADYDFRQLTSDPERVALPPGPPQFNHDWVRLFINPMPDEHAALQDLLRRDPGQYLIANTQFLGAWPTRQGAPGLRPPRWLAVSAIPLFLSSEDTTFFGPVPVGPGEDSKAANRAVHAEFAAAMRPTDDRVKEVLTDLGADGSVPTFTDAVYTLADETVVLTVPGFEFERSDLPDNVHLVGILPAPGVDENWEPPAWWGDLDGGRPVVVVTQGTLANEDLSQLIEPALTGLADRDVTVVAALGRDPSALSVPVPANARVADYIPFGALLPKASVLVTNGGAGGTHQALAAGVPVVVAGETEDKPANAARVAYHRLGINLQTATPTPQAVAGAVDSLLEDPEVRENVLRLAKVYAQHDALDAIERLLLG
jgi:UDP:flavonoid glycosyltransferase YjiC (YdhE family)